MTLACETGESARLEYGRVSHESEEKDGAPRNQGGDNCVIDQHICQLPRIITLFPLRIVLFKESFQFVCYFFILICREAILFSPINF